MFPKSIGRFSHAAYGSSGSSLIAVSTFATAAFFGLSNFVS